MDKHGEKYYSMPQTIWSLTTLLETLENVFSTPTGLKFVISFLLGLLLSSGITDVVLVFSGKNVLSNTLFDCICE